MTTSFQVLRCWVKRMSPNCLYKMNTTWPLLTFLRITPLASSSYIPLSLVEFEVSTSQSKYLNSSFSLL